MHVKLRLYPLDEITLLPSVLIPYPLGKITILPSVVIPSHSLSHVIKIESYLYIYKFITFIHTFSIYYIIMKLLNLL